MNEKYFNRNLVKQPVSPAWRELGLAVHGDYGRINLWNDDLTFDGEYVKIENGKIIAKNENFNSAPIVNVYDEVLPDGYYFGNIYRKQGLDYSLFGRFTYKGKACQLLHHQDFDFGKHEKKGDCVIRLDGATRNKNVRVDELEFPHKIFVFQKSWEMKEDNSFVPEFKDLRAYPNRTDQWISFTKEHDRNNENLGGVGVNADKLVQQKFVFANSPATDEFRAWLEKETRRTIVPILCDNDNWEENQEHDRYEGYRLENIYLKGTVYSKLNAAVREMFTNFKGVKYVIERF